VRSLRRRAAAHRRPGWSRAIPVRTSTSTSTSTLRGAARHGLVRTRPARARGLIRMGRGRAYLRRAPRAATRGPPMSEPCFCRAVTGRARRAAVRQVARGQPEHGQLAGGALTGLRTTRWVRRFTPLVIDTARPCRHAPVDRWFVDETYVKVAPGCPHYPTPT
jgi:hypothetical protein